MVMEFMKKVTEIVNRYFIPFATHRKEPVDGVIQLWGVTKFGKGQKKTAKFYVTFTGPGLIVSVEATDNGLEFLKLIKRILGEPRGAYSERKETYSDFLREHYTAEWYPEELHDMLDELDMQRAMLRAHIKSEIEPLEL